MTDEMRKHLKKDKKKHLIVTLISSVVCLCLGISITAVVMKNQGNNKTNSDANLAKFEEIYNVIADEWYFGDQAEDEATYIDRALSAMVNGQDTDSYLTYYPAPESEVKVTYGLGVVVTSYDGYLIIDRVYANSPASRAGLMAEDIITAVNGVSIRYLELSAVSSLIQGDYNTNVSLSIIRNDVNKTITATRNVWVEESVRGYDHGTYGVLEISSFNDDTASSADTVLKGFTNNDGNVVKDLIIDLRDNGGGLIMAFTALADLFTPKGTKFGHYEFKNSKDSYDVYASSAQKYTFDNIYILINGNSASASESFTCAMKDNLKNVTVIGTLSYGKGIAQRTVSFSDGSSLRYTYAEFYRTNGAKLHKIGITPDVNLPQKGAQVVYDTAYAEGETFEEHLTKYLNAMGFSASSYSALLEAYQTARSIPVTGVYDDATKGKINKDLYEQRQLGKTNQLAEVVDLLKK